MEYVEFVEVVEGVEFFEYVEVVVEVEFVEVVEVGDSVEFVECVECVESVECVECVEVVEFVEFVQVIGAQRPRKPEADLLLEAAQCIADECLRQHVTMPSDPKDAGAPLLDPDSGGRLPAVCCAFRECRWCVEPGPSTAAACEDDCEHPWDQLLREHVAKVHGSRMRALTEPSLGAERATRHLWDLYKAALSAQERRSIPVVGASIERRVFEYAATVVYNDECIRSLICFACGHIKVDKGCRW